MSKLTKPAGFQPRVAPARPLTEEEKKIKVMQLLQQNGVELTDIADAGTDAQLLLIGSVSNMAEYWD